MATSEPPESTAQCHDCSVSLPPDENRYLPAESEEPCPASDLESTRQTLRRLLRFEDRLKKPSDDDLVSVGEASAVRKFEVKFVEEPTGMWDLDSGLWDAESRPTQKANELRRFIEAEKYKKEHTYCIFDPDPEAEPEENTRSLLKFKGISSISRNTRSIRFSKNEDLLESHRTLTEEEQQHVGRLRGLMGEKAQ